MNPARRMFGLIEPIALVAFFSEEPNDALQEALGSGYRNYWDGYFAGRAGPLGPVGPEVVHALFYNFAPGEAARHVPYVWDHVTPEDATAARLRGCAAALRRILGDLTVVAAADALIMPATAAPTEGRPMYAALRAVPVPDDPVERLWHAANLLREHRGDGHVHALVAHDVGGLESHALLALAEGMPAEKFGRIHHLPAAQLAGIADGMRAKGLIGEDGWLTDHGRDVKARVEAMTDDLGRAPYEEMGEPLLTQLYHHLEPITARLVETGSR